MTVASGRIFVACLLGLAACHPHLGAGTAVPRLVQHPTRPALRVSWTFQAKPDGCIAHGEAEPVRLLVTLQRRRPVVLTLALQVPPSAAPATVPLRFIGRSGYWQVVATWSPAGLAATLGKGEAGFDTLLVLLNGGVLEAGEPVQPLVVLNLPQAWPPGQSWLDCARAQLR